MSTLFLHQFAVHLDKTAVHHEKTVVHHDRNRRPGRMEQQELNIKGKAKNDRIFDCQICSSLTFPSQCDDVR